MSRNFHDLPSTYDEYLALSADKMPSLFPQPPSWPDNPSLCQDICLNWNQEHVAGFLKVFGYNQRIEDYKYRKTNGILGVCDNCKKQNVMAECGICGEIYCCRECLRSSWETGHRTICETIYDQNEVQVRMNHLEAVDKYNQKKLNASYGFAKDAKPQSFLTSSRATLEEMRLLQSVKIPDATKDVKNEKNIRAIRCFNTDCLKMSENLKKCSKCSNAYYCSVSCQHSHWPKHKTDCKSSKVINQETEYLKVKKMYVRWKIPRTNKLKHLAHALLSKNDKYKTTFVIITLQHVGDGKLVLSLDPLQVFLITTSPNDDTSIYTKAYLDSIRSNIAKYKCEDILPDIKNHNEAVVVFSIKDIVNPLSEPIYFVFIVVIDSEASETVTSVDNITEAHYIALIEDINATPDGNL